MMATLYGHRNIRLAGIPLTLDHIVILLVNYQMRYAQKQHSNLDYTTAFTNGSIQCI